MKIVCGPCRQKVRGSIPSSALQQEAPEQVLRRQGLLVCQDSVEILLTPLRTRRLPVIDRLGEDVGRSGCLFVDDMGVDADGDGGSVWPRRAATTWTSAPARSSVAA